MLDREGFRPNVGIILLNPRNQVFWGKRLRTHSWQFPQGGIKHGELPEQAMFRELHEEVGLRDGDVRILARTQGWLRYYLPERFIRQRENPRCIGQKQKWFLLELTGGEDRIDLTVMRKPEFEDWTWVSYWYPLNKVIDFKREVYLQALKQLAPALPVARR